MFKREFGKIKKKHIIIKREEDKIEKTIQSNINQFWINQDNKGNKVTNSLNTFNPLTSHLYFKISFIFFKIFITSYIASSRHQQFNLKQKEMDKDKEVQQFDNNNNANPEIPIIAKEKEIMNNCVVIDTKQQNGNEKQQLMLKDNC